MGEYRVDDSFKMIGAFWKLNEPDDTFTGTLTSRSGRVEILTAPIYKKLDNEQARRGLVELLNGDSERQRISCVLGFTEKESRCTFFNALLLNGGGNTNFPTMQQVSAMRYLPARIVMGLHLESADAKLIDGGAFYFTKIHQLLPTPWASKTSKAGASHRVPWKAKKVFSLTNSDIDAKVICEVFAGGSSKAKKGTLIKPIPRIRIKPKTPQSVDWFAALAFRTENFLSLFLGVSVSLKRVQLFQGEDAGWLVQGINHRKEKYNPRLSIRCTAQIMADAFSKWLSVPVEKQPVELTVLGMIRKSKVFDETMFLSYAQALEGFGRIRFASGNKKRSSYKALIQQTYDLLSLDFARQLVGDRAEFIKKIMQTRNYYTHLGSEKGSAVIASNGELYLINKRLQAFLRCVMLIDLDVPEKYLRDPILYQADRWKLY